MTTTTTTDLAARLRIIEAVRASYAQTEQADPVIDWEDEDECWADDDDNYA